MYGEVEEILALSPSMIRIVLGGIGLDGFTPNESTDQYINAYFIPENASYSCLLYTSPSPRDAHESRMPSSA